MQKRRRMDELNCRRQFDRRLARGGITASQHRARHRHHRAHALAAGRDQMTGKLRDQGNVAVHPRDDCRVDPFHVGRQHCDKWLQRRRFVPGGYGAR